MMGIMVPETWWANNKFCNKEPSVASSWPFYFYVYTSELRTIQYDGKFKLYHCNWKQTHVNHARFDVTVICTLYNGKCQITQVNRAPLHVPICLFIESDVQVTSWRIRPLTSAHYNYISWKGVNTVRHFSGFTFSSQHCGLHISDTTTETPWWH